MITDAARLAELVADIAEQPSWPFTLLGESTQVVTITMSVRDRDCLVAALRSSPVNGGESETLRSALRETENAISKYLSHQLSRDDSWRLLTAVRNNARDVLKALPSGQSSPVSDAIDVNSPTAVLWSEAMKLKSENECLREALEQAVDDFGDSHCVCEDTKQMCIAALFPSGQSSPASDIRAEIIEECAAVAEQYDNYTVDGRPSAVGTVIATALRGLKS
jgi:hypothetical protein